MAQTPRQVLGGIGRSLATATPRRSLTPSLTPRRRRRVRSAAVLPFCDGDDSPDNPVCSRVAFVVPVGPQTPRMVSARTRLPPLRLLTSSRGSSGSGPGSSARTRSLGAAPGAAPPLSAWGADATPPRQQSEELGENLRLAGVAPDAAAADTKEAKQLASRSAAPPGESAAPSPRGGGAALPGTAPDPDEEERGGPEEGRREDEEAVEEQRAKDASEHTFDSVFRSIYHRFIGKHDRVLRDIADATYVYEDQTEESPQQPGIELPRSATAPAGVTGQLDKALVGLGRELGAAMLSQVGVPPPPPPHPTASSPNGRFATPTRGGEGVDEQAEEDFRRAGEVFGTTPREARSGQDTTSQPCAPPPPPRRPPPRRTGPHQSPWAPTLGIAGAARGIHAAVASAAGAFTPRRSSSVQGPASACPVQAATDEEREDVGTMSVDSSVARRRPASARETSTGGGGSGSIRSWFSPRRHLPSTPCRNARGASTRASGNTGEPPRPEPRPTTAPASSVQDSKQPPPQPNISDLEVLVRPILAAVYGRQLDDNEVASAVGHCPEVAWIAQCALMCPLLPGWRATPGNAASEFLYSCELTGEVCPQPPHLPRFARLARLVLHAVQHPNDVNTVVAWVRREAENAFDEATRLQEGWRQCVDDVTGTEYWHCPITGRSSWESPSSSAAYAASVAERLLDTSAFAGACAATARVTATRAVAFARTSRRRASRGQRCGAEATMAPTSLAPTTSAFGVTSMAVSEAGVTRGQLFDIYAVTPDAKGSTDEADDSDEDDNRAEDEAVAPDGPEGPEAFEISTPLKERRAAHSEHVDAAPPVTPDAACALAGAAAALANAAAALATNRSSHDVTSALATAATAVAAPRQRPHPTSATRTPTDQASASQTRREVSHRELGGGGMAERPDGVPCLRLSEVDAGVGEHNAKPARPAGVATGAAGRARGWTGGA